MTPRKRPDSERLDTAERLSIDRLEYLTDMIAEMRELAAREGLTTLAGLLALAYVDAKQHCRKPSNDQAQR